MDRYSEIEVKFEAPSVEPHQLLAFAADVRSDPILKPYGYGIAGAIIVGGWDTYYQQGDKILRHRCDGDGDRQTNCLTTKSRKSEKDLTDRHEVDLFFRAGTPPEDIETFLERTGWEAIFTINKYYTVLHLKSTAGADNIVCLALYDTWEDDRRQARRFLEVEIERDSTCTTTQGRAALKKWVQAVRARFGLPEPLNQSLYEIYAPKK